MLYLLMGKLCHHFKPNLNNLCCLYYLISLILIGFRQSQILMFLCFYSINWYQNMKNYKFNTFYILCFLTALIFLMSLSSVDYFNKVIRLSSEYPTNINISTYYNIDNNYLNIILSKGIQVLNSSNSYSIKYDGADKTPEEKWLPFANKFKLFKKKD